MRFLSSSVLLDDHCVRVGGSSTLGWVTGSGLWGPVSGVILALQDWQFHAMAMMQTPLFVRVSKVIQRHPRSCHLHPPPVVDDLLVFGSSVLSHIYMHGNIQGCNIRLDV